jgi:hypothetical protein
MQIHSKDDKEEGKQEDDEMKEVNKEEGKDEETFRFCRVEGERRATVEESSLPA